jgi:protein TonB
VLALHLVIGLSMLQRSPETAPTEAPEPIAMIDLPPAPVLPDAVATADLPPAAALSVPVEEASEVGGSIVPDLAPQAPEPVDAPVETVERLPAETAEPPPVPTVRPPDAAVAEAVPPDASLPLAATEAAPVEPLTAVPPDVASEVAPTDAPTTAVEPPIEAAPIVPDAAVVLSGPVALPPLKPAEAPPPVEPPVRQTEAKKPEAKTTERKQAERKEPVARKTDRTAEKPAAKKPAGPATDKPKVGGRQQQAATSPQAAGGGASADALRRYQAKVRADIEREVRRMQRDKSGSADVNLSFARGGALATVRIARSSGDSAVDRTVLLAVKRASPFPAAPPDLPQSTFNWQIRVNIN